MLAGLFRAGPFIYTVARDVGARIRRGLLNGIREAASGNFRADCVPDLLLVELLRPLPDQQLDVITFVVFNRVDVTFDFFEGSTKCFPRWARSGVEVVSLGHLWMFGDMAN